MDPVWDFRSVLDHWPVLWVGLRGTVAIFAVTVVLGLGGGLVIGILRHARPAALRWPATAFVELFRNTPLLAARQKFGQGKIVIPTPAFSSPSSIAVRREADKTFRDWVDHTIFYYYETGRTQQWYEEFLVDFGLDPKASPVIQRELLFN